MLTFPKLAMLLLIVLVVFGASRLPDIGTGLGKGIKNFKDSFRDDDENKLTAGDRKDA